MKQGNIRKQAILQEANIKECKVCKEKKLRILYGKFPSLNNKYVDDSGALWSGRTCPPCNTKRINEKMKQLRADRKNKHAGESFDSFLQEENIKLGDK